MENLRREIQLDRLEIQRMIQNGFDKVHDSLDKYSKENAERFEELDHRLTAVEYDSKVLKRGAGTILGTIFAASVSYIFSIFK